VPKRTPFPENEFPFPETLKIMIVVNYWSCLLPALWGKRKGAIEGIMYSYGNRVSALDQFQHAPYENGYETTVLAFSTIIVGRKIHWLPRGRYAERWKDYRTDHRITEMDWCGSLPIIQEFLKRVPWGSLLKGSFQRWIWEGRTGATALYTLGRHGEWSENYVMTQQMGREGKLIVAERSHWYGAGLWNGNYQ